MDRNGTSGWPRVETTNLNLVSLNRMAVRTLALCYEVPEIREEANVKDHKYQLILAV